MRFPVVFYRYVTTPLAGYSPNGVLGADTAPSPLAIGTTATQPPNELTSQPDNLLACRFMNKDGAVVQRVGVLYGYIGAGTAPALTASLYFLEETTGLWFLADTKSKALVKGGVTYFDAQPIADGVPFGGGSQPGLTPDQTLYARQPSNPNYLLVVDKVGTVDGQYFFGMAPLLIASP